MNQSGKARLAMCYQVMGYLKEHFQQKLIDYVENTVSENHMDILEEIEEPRLMFLKKFVYLTSIEL